jgi:hypothetical protein
MSETVRNSLTREIYMRLYYTHKRNGVYYCEMVNPETGTKLISEFLGRA